MAARVYDRAAVGRVRRASWGCGAAGSAPHWQCGGQGFESPQLHPIGGPRIQALQLLTRSLTRSLDVSTGHELVMLRSVPTHSTAPRSTSRKRGAVWRDQIRTFP